MRQERACCPRYPLRARLHPTTAVIPVLVATARQAIACNRREEGIHSMMCRCSVWQAWKIPARCCLSNPLRVAHRSGHW